MTIVYNLLKVTSSTMHFAGYLSLREKVDLKSNCNGWVGCEGIYLFCVTVIAKRGM